MPSSARLSFVFFMALATAAGAQHAPTGIAGPRPWVDGMCRDSETNCGGAVPLALLGGGLVGGLVGALIGGQFPKTEDP
jgi:hypothetical protein